MAKFIGYLILVFVLCSVLFLGVNGERGVFLSAIFGGTFTALMAIYLEHELRPKIRIIKEPNHPVLSDGRKFLRVIVENQGLWWPLSLIMDRRPAQHTKAWITFLTENNDLVFNEGRRMIGRWSNTPEPVRPISVLAAPGEDPKITMLWDLSVTHDAVDIAAGSSELLDIVMRTPNDSGCLGWHNRLIQRPDVSHEDRFDLPRGRYHALVQINISGRIVAARFRVVCDVGIGDFRLEAIH
jgi:hypothetical protein